MNYITLKPRRFFTKVLLRENAVAAPIQVGEPYVVKQVGDKYKVYKANAAGKATGKALGSHDTEKDAEDQVKALYSNEVDKMVKGFRDEVAELAEVYFEDSYEPTYGATSFQDLLSVEEAVARTRLLRKRTLQLMGMMLEALYLETDPVSVFQSLFREYLTIAANTLQSDAPPATVEKAIGEVSTPPLHVTEIQELEDFSLDVPTSLAESDIDVIQAALDKAAITNERRRPLYMDIQVIEPGWGNQVDNHYYPSEMLKQFGHVFTGAKMYETDHRAEEKSTRTWVSTAVGLQGFTETGAPIQRVFVHDPNFAEKLRNLQDENLLSKMECSIYATGAIESDDFEDEATGRTGRRVVSLDEGAGIDWVTAAGAGGRALHLIETDKGGISMPKTKEELEAEEVEATEAAETTRVSIRENEDDAEAVTDDPEVTTEEPVVEPVEEEPSQLEAEEVEELIAQTHLPAPTKARLQKGTYNSLAELKAVVDEAVAEVKAITGSGKVFAQNSQEVTTENAAAYIPASEEELKEQDNQFRERFGLKRIQSR